MAGPMKGRPLGMNDERLQSATESRTADEDSSRREVLKRFGRYAAAAPAAMLLLGPRSGRAHHRGWHFTPPGWLRNGKAGDGGYG